jgi:hypothetical protein
VNPLVKIDNSISNTRIINLTSGILQGGHLSPLLFLLLINDLNKCFNTCNFLLFADDMKLYMSIRSDEDTMSLQHDLDQFSLWCSLNGIFFNTFKCVHISFNRSKSNINSIYHINDIPLNSVNQVQKLGIILANDLFFNAHINKIYGTSLRILGFIKYTCHDFNNPLCLKVLHCSLVRSSLEFGTVLWNTNQLQFINKLEKVQRIFLRFYAYKTMRLNQNMDVIANFAGLKSLKTRRLVFDTTFVYKILNGEINCPELLQKIDLKVPSFNFRHNPPFAIQ